MSGKKLDMASKTEGDSNPNIRFRFDTFIENKRHSVQQDEPKLEIIESIENQKVLFNIKSSVF